MATGLNVAQIRDRAKSFGGDISESDADQILKSTFDQSIFGADPGQVDEALRSRFASPSAVSGNVSNPQESQDEQIRKMIELNRQANQPAVQSLQSSLPEISQRFDTERTRLKSESATLQDRYAQLLDDVKSQGAKRETEQTKTTARELGRRGISSQSGLFDQELQENLDPIRSDTQSLTKNIGIEQESGLTNIRNLIASLTGQETAEQRSVRNAIAQLQAGAGQTGIQQGIQSAQFASQQAITKAELALKKQAQKIAQAETEAERKFQQKVYDEVTLPTAEAQIANINSTISNRGSESDSLNTFMDTLLEQFNNEETEKPPAPGDIPTGNDRFEVIG